MKKYSYHILAIILLYASIDKLYASIELVDSINAAYDYQFIVSNTNRSIQIFNENINLAESINYKDGLAKSMSLLGLAYYINGQYDEATSNYIKSIKLYEEIGDLDQQASLYGEFGYQLKRRDMLKANEYMRLAINIAEKNNLEYLTTHKLYSNYGVLKEMEGKLDSAMYYYRISLKMNLEANDSLGLPYSYNKIAGIMAMKGNFQAAYQNLKLSDEIRNNEKGDFGRAENLSVRGDILYLENKINDAISIYTECLKVSKGIGYKYLIQYCSQKLRELYQKVGNYKQALFYFDYYTNYTDSLTNLETDARIAELEISYETEKKDRLIAESNLEIEEKSRQFLIALSVAFFLAISSIGIYKYQKQKRETEKKELKLQTQLKEAELENKISSEKLRISRELHDNIGSQLTFIISSLDNISYAEKNEKLLTKLSRLSSFGRDTMKELRNTIWAMKNEDGDINSLNLKLNEFVQTINETSDNFNITISNKANGSIKLSSAQMLAVFRIVQEAIQNTIKYTDADLVQIDISENQGGFDLRIVDNGKGFDVSNTKSGNGLGNMKQRCIEAGGKFFIESNSKGTIIKCSFVAN